MKRQNKPILLVILVSLLLGLWGSKLLLNLNSTGVKADDITFNTDVSDFILDIAIADLNQDGIDDVVASSADDTIYAIDGSTGTLLWNNSAPSDDVWTITTADFNRDKVNDILAGSWDSYVYIVDGLTGTTILSKSVAPSNWISSVAAGKFNNDQFPDVLIGSSDTNLYAISGDGTVLWNNTSPSDFVLTVETVDLNQDGFDDAVVGSADSNVYAIDGLTGSTLWINQDPEGWIHSITVGDSIGDSIMASSNTGVYTFDRTGKTLWTSPEEVIDISSLARGDFNRDGTDDALAGSANMIYALDGHTGQPLWSNSDPLGVIECLTVGDFNNDGVDDGFAGSQDTNLYTIDGLTGDTLQIVVDPTDMVWTLAIGDFNGDGIDDGIAGSFDSNLYTIMGQDRPPRINHPPDLQYTEGEVGLVIKWIPSDNDPSSYVMTRNDSRISEDAWSGEPITASLDGLSNGTYLFELTVWDIDGNLVSDVVVVVVIDSTPTIDQVPDVQYVAGQTGNAITWNPYDEEPFEYEITRNGLQIGSDTWSGESITTNIDELDVGTYTYVLTVRDDIGNSASDEVLVTVVVDIDPRIDHPEDITYTEGRRGNEITWNAIDEDPFQYKATIDDESFARSSWDGTPITLNVDGLSVGEHTLVLTTIDTTGKEVTDTVIITVLPSVSEFHFSLRVISLAILFSILWGCKKRKIG